MDPSNVLRLAQYGQAAVSLEQMGRDVLQHVCLFLEAKDVLSLAKVSKSFRDVSLEREVWVGLLLRSFSSEELPQDLSFLSEHSAPLLRSQFWKLLLQRPAFLSDAPRTSEIIEHTGSHFRKVLHIDGRRDLNFTTVFRGIPPGQYCVVWRVMLQPGYVRGYCNFRAIFSRPPSFSTKSRRACGGATRGRHGAEEGEMQLRQGGRGRWRFGALMAPSAAEQQMVDSDSDREHRVEALPGLRLRRGLRWLPGCMSAASTRVLDAGRPLNAAAAGGTDAPGPAPSHPVVADLPAPLRTLPAPYRHQPEHEGDAGAGHPEIEPLPAPAPEPQALPTDQPQPQPPAQPPRAAAPGAIRQGALQRQLASASAKRNAALAAGGGGPHYVSRWLSPLWGGHACSWRQLDPAGPLGHGSWRMLHLGSLTVRRTADVHLHSVMVQLRPHNAALEELALPAGETSWRGALVDFVELVPVRRAGLLEGLLPSFLLPGSPVFPEMRDVVEVPRL